MNALISIQAITFDVGGTLIECSPSVGHVYAEVAARHGCAGLCPDRLNRQFIAAWDSFPQFNHTRAEWADLVDTTFRGLTGTPPSQSFFHALYARFTQPEVWRVFDDVVPTLEALASSGLKLGIISNWDDRLRPLLHRLRLLDYFETTLISHEVGFTKPSRVIFDLAAEKLASPPGAILHVGDSPSQDVDGALAAGFQARLLHRDPKGPPEPGQLSSLAELVE